MFPAKKFNFRLLPIALLAITFGAGLIWRFTPLYHRINLHQVVGTLRGLEGHAWTPLAIMGVYIAAGLVLFLHAVVLWATVFTFDPWHSIYYCEIGSMASGLTMYGLGRVMRPEVVRRLARTYLGNVSEALGRRGFFTIVILHWFPICPYSVLNLLAGSTHIRFRDFALGTLVGITPGIIFISFFGERVRQAVNHPQWQSAFSLLGFIVVGAIVLLFGRRVLRASKTDEK